MTSLQIASDLELAATDALEAGFYQGVEFSQPVAMLDAARVKVSGVVQRITGTDFQLAAIVEGSTDLSVWHAVYVEVSLLTFDRAPHAFAVPSAAGVAVAHAYVRVKWVLYATGDPPELKAGRSVLLSAHISTGA